MTTKTSISTNFLQSLLTFSVSHLLSSPSNLVPFHLPLSPCLYRRLLIIFLIFPPHSVSSLFHHSCSFSPPVSCSVLVFGSPLPAALSLLSCLTSPPYALFLSHTNSVFYLFTFLPPHSASLLAGVLGLFTYSLSLLLWRYTNPSLSLVTV